MPYARYGQRIPHDEEISGVRDGSIVCHHGINNFHHFHHGQIHQGNVCIVSTFGNDSAISTGNSHVGMGIELSCQEATVGSHGHASNVCSTHRSACCRCIGWVILIRQWPPLMRTAGASCPLLSLLGLEDAV